MTFSFRLNSLNMKSMVLSALYGQLMPRYEPSPYPGPDMPPSGCSPNTFDSWRGTSFASPFAWSVRATFYFARAKFSCLGATP